MRSRCNPFSSTWRAVASVPPVGGLAIHYLGQVWCFGLNGLSLSRPDHFAHHGEAEGSIRRNRPIRFLPA